MPFEACDPFRLVEGVYRPPLPVQHREEEYSSEGFAVLYRMQSRHFWYRGRHRFLLHAVRRWLAKKSTAARALSLIDVGGGCGGWIADLMRRVDLSRAEVALADSSLVALEYAATVLPETVKRYQVDLLDLHWENRWDIAFLLDVVEHIPDHAAAARQVFRALAPGGVLFVTAPALKSFWTWNDELAGHQRRYARGDLTALAEEAGFIVRDVRYFNFFLSPLLLADRWLVSRRVARLTREDRGRLAERMHGVPRPLVNCLLNAVFSMETPLGHFVRFPWGTSILGVFQKPDQPGRS